MVDGSYQGKTKAHQERAGAEVLSQALAKVGKDVPATGATHAVARALQANQDLWSEVESLTRARLGLLLALLDWRNVRLGAGPLADLAGEIAGLGRPISTETVWRARHTESFRGLLSRCRRALYPEHAQALELAIIGDALTPLDKAYHDNGKHCVSFAAQVIESRAQAAAFLGVTVTSSAKVEHSGSVDMVHRLAKQYPPACWDEWKRTRKWPVEQYGPAPWDVST